jgi:hypothetical protein
MFDRAFIQLGRTEQTAVLKSLQEGTASGSVWQKMSAATFFEELLAEATEIFYAHPSAQEEIAYTGMADAFGWTKIGLNETDDLTRMNLDDEDLPE